jgi:Fur family ferric uptake transcriptional regulator
VKEDVKILMTEQRQVILEELSKTTSHPTADEVFLKVRKRLPRISLGTVYRTLELLSENRIIKKLEWAGRQKRYDGNFKTHYHIRCLKCDRMDDVFIESFSVIEETLETVTDFEIIGHRLEILGICSTCKKTTAVRKKPKKV